MAAEDLPLAGRVVGVTAKPVDDRGRRVGDEVTFTATVGVVPPGTGTPTGTVGVSHGGCFDT